VAGLGLINESVKRWVLGWLSIEPTLNTSQQFTINKTDTFRVQALKNTMWYRGQANELHQFYGQYNGGYTANSLFWKQKSTIGIDFRKIHTGLPALMIDKLVDIAVNDMSVISITVPNVVTKLGEPVMNPEAMNRWEAIAEEHDFKEKVVKQAVREMLLGDATFKISGDSKLSDYPIIEVIQARDVDYEYERGRLVAVKFFSNRKIDKKHYVLVERYDIDGITYELYDRNGNPKGTPAFIRDMFGLEAVQFADKDSRLLMAIPMMLRESKVFPGRGKSIFDDKEGAFDSYDEAWSQWMDAIRAGRTTTYIPEALLPRDPNTGVVLKPNALDNQYIRTDNNLGENANNEIKVATPEIRSEQYLSAYISALDLSLQSVISPSTLGIDVKKLDNAEAQREKEKTTLYTRDAIVGVLEKTIPKLVETVLIVDDIAHGRPAGLYEVSVEFTDYANPSFEAQVETVGKAYTDGVMSIEQSVEQLYGDTKTPEEKALEVTRLKTEKGFIAEPSVASFDDPPLEDEGDNINDPPAEPEVVA